MTPKIVQNFILLWMDSKSANHPLLAKFLAWMASQFTAYRCEPEGLKHLREEQKELVKEVT